MLDYEQRASQYTIYTIYEAGMAEGAAHERRETTPFPAETPVTPAPVQDDELIEIAERAYNSENGSSPSFHYCSLRAAIAAVRPQIEAAAREGYWKQEDVEKAIQDEGDRISWQGFGAETTFAKAVRARLTPTPEPIEKLRCICGYDARNNERDHNVECFVPQDFAQNSPPPSGRSRNDQK
jgi:hypothetical protein